MFNLKLPSPVHADAQNERRRQGVDEAKKIRGGEYEIESYEPTQFGTAAARNEDELKAQIYRAKEEEALMRSTSDGKSWLLAREVCRIHEKHRYNIGTREISTVAVDDLVALAKRFLLLHQSFVEASKPTLVTIAYHYTKSVNMHSIRENGLMTPADQRKRRVNSDRSNAVGFYGPGIYLSSNPYAFHSFDGGDVGLMVAVIFGKTCRVRHSIEASSKRCAHDTVVGNKSWQPSSDWESDRHCHFSDEYVLQQSAQCLPLFRFSSKVVDRCSDGVHPRSGGNDLIWDIHQDCQELIDTLMNFDSPTELVRVRPTDSNKIIQGNLGAVAYNQSRFPTAPKGQRTIQLREIIRYEAPEVKEHSSRCTQCSTFVTLTYGESPSGTMTITRSADSKADHVDPIVIQYHLPSGWQKRYHPCPGAPYKGTSITAYLPDNDGGREVLLRLKYAWLHGVTFAVSKSKPYTATLSFIPHMIQFTGGSASRLQDDTFFTVVKKELDAIGVPPMSVLRDCFRPSTARAIPPSARDTKGKVARSPELAGLTTAKLPSVPKHQVLQYTAPDELPRLPPKTRAPCPTCGGLHFARTVGPCPSGHMIITHSSFMQVVGFENSTTHTFILQYELEGGIQKSYHPNPGLSFAGTSRTAYLPDNDMGRMVLERLKFAWLHGLTFMIDKSRTKGNVNTTKWSSIRHKTTLGTGVHGFPDPEYFTKVNADLDACDVPKYASLCSTKRTSTKPRRISGYATNDGNDDDDNDNDDNNDNDENSEDNDDNDDDDDDDNDGSVSSEESGSTVPFTLLDSHVGHLPGTLARSEDRLDCDDDNNCTLRSHKGRPSRKVAPFREWKIKQNRLRRRLWRV